MDSIFQTTLSTVISQLANFFGMTTETIMQNAPYWLAKYGWYSVLGNMGSNIITGIFLALLAFIVVVLICCALENDTIPLKTTVVICIIAFILPSVISFAHCAVAPEIYGLEALIKLIK